MSSLENKNIYINGQTFCRLVESKSFSKTAVLLNVNQSTISRRIEVLEDELAKTLIIRNTRRHEITPDGLRFYDFFTKHENSFAKLMNNYISNDAGYDLIIKLSMPNGLANYILGPMLPVFLAKHPNIRLEISYQGREIDLIKEDYDLAIQREVPAQQTTKVKKLATPRLKLYCTPEYKKRYGLPKTLDELLTHNFCGGITDKNEKLTKWKVVSTNNTEESFELTHNQKIYTDNIEPNALLVKSGHFIVGGTDDMFKKQLKNKSVIRVLEQYEFMNRSLYLIKNDDIKNPLIDTFANFIADCFSKYEMNISNNHL